MMTSNPKITTQQRLLGYEFEGEVQKNYMP
jgi:hypothetical protein